MKKTNERKYTIVGNISESVSIEWNLIDIVDKPIYKTIGFYKHIAKHIKEFKNLESYENAVLNIENIILNPELVYYNQTRESLEYFKMLDEYVCVIVNIKREKPFILASLFPISVQKLINKKEKSMYKKYISNFNEEEYNVKQKEIVNQK